MLEERPAATYDFRGVEAKWQAAWERDRLYRAHDDDPRPKFYALEMLPYPSGDLHVGHAKNYTLGDVVARAARMRGYNVLHPMGWDAFGLPAENAAIQRGADPLTWTRENIANMQRQIRLIGTSYDWSREFATCDPSYYRWNQWLFARLYESGLAYKHGAPGQLVPVRQDRPRQRAGRERPLLALRQPGRAAHAFAVVPQDHRLRRPAARGTRPLAGVARPHQDDAAQLDRPVRRA